MKFVEFYKTVGKLWREFYGSFYIRIHQHASGAWSGEKQLQGDGLYSLFNNLDQGRQIKFEFENPNYYWLRNELKLPNFLKDQILRASSSIALILAEGSGKRTPANQRRFYAMAYGSFCQCQGSSICKKINIVKLNHLQNQLGAILYTLNRKTVDWTETTTATNADAAAD